MKALLFALLLVAFPAFGQVRLVGGAAGSGGVSLISEDAFTPTDFTQDANCVFAGVYDGATTSALGTDQCTSDGSHDFSDCTNAPSVVTTGLPTGSPSGHEGLYFDRTNSECMSASDDDEWEAHDNMTIVTWARWDDITQGGNMRVIDKDTSWYLSTENSDVFNGYIGSAENSVEGYTSDDTWYHIAVRRNSTDDMVEIFTDAEGTCENGCVEQATTPAGNANDVELGGSATSYHHGDVYDLAFFDRYLDERELCEICRFGLTGQATDRKSLCRHCFIHEVDTHVDWVDSFNVDYTCTDCNNWTAPATGTTCTVNGGSGSGLGPRLVGSSWTSCVYDGLDADKGPMSSTADHWVGGRFGGNSDYSGGALRTPSGDIGDSQYFYGMWWNATTITIRVCDGSSNDSNCDTGSMCSYSHGGDGASVGDSFVYAVSGDGDDTDELCVWLFDDGTSGTTDRCDSSTWGDATFCCADGTTIDNSEWDNYDIDCGTNTQCTSWGSTGPDDISGKGFPSTSNVYTRLYDGGGGTSWVRGCGGDL